MLHLPVEEAVPVIDNSSDEQGSGSGDFVNAVAVQADFPENEVIGQLFAYMRSDNEVILGTRRTTVMNQRIAVGISSVAEETYKCVAANENTNEEEEANIIVQGKVRTVVFFSYTKAAIVIVIDY